MSNRLARLEIDGWELESAVARHERSPDTFWIPSEADRRNVRAGQAVKLIFRLRVEHEVGRPEVVTERMWVFVTGRGADVCEGRLQSEPLSTGDLRPGALVRFCPEHVADINLPPAHYEPV